MRLSMGECLLTLLSLLSVTYAIERVRLSDGFDLQHQFPTGKPISTIITIRYQNDANCGNCESDIRFYYEKSQSLYPDPTLRDFPIRIKISNNAQFPVESDMKKDGQIDCRLRSHTFLERNPILESIWRLDIVKVSANDLRVFFQGYPAASIHSSQRLDGIRSLMLYSEVAGKEQYIDVIYPNSLVPSLSVHNWQNGGSEPSSQVVADIGTFSIGTRYRFITFMNSYDNTNTFRFVGLRLKHHLMRTPVVVMQSWHDRHQRISLHSKEEYDNYSKNKITCFDGNGLGDIAHFDITRMSWSTVKMRLFHVKTATIECELSLPQMGRDLDQALQVIVGNGASLLYLNRTHLSDPC